MDSRTTPLLWKVCAAKGELIFISSIMQVFSVRPGRQALSRVLRNMLQQVSRYPLPARIFAALSNTDACAVHLVQLAV